MCAQPRRKSDPEKGRATARLKREEIEEGQTESGDREYQCQRNLESIPYTGYQRYGIAHSPRLIIYTSSPYIQKFMHSSVQNHPFS